MRPGANGTAIVTCAAVAVLIGSSVLVGWAFHVRILVTWLPGFVSLKANTALCFVAGGVALFFHRRAGHDGRIGWLVSGCTSVVLVVGGLTLLEYLSGWNLGMDQILVHDTAPGNGTSHTGRMAPNTALAFALLGGALHAARGESDLRRRVSQASGFGALFLVMTSFVGYLYGAHVLIGLLSLTRMAVHAIVAMLALGVGTLLLTADGGWLIELTTPGPGGVVARRLLPAALVVPMTIGIVTLAGYRAGLYDAAFGSAFVAVAETVSFAILVYACARFLNETARAKVLASLDELTGLLNRRAFLSQCEEWLASAHRVGADALVFFIDLDELKGINDRLGHAAGDMAIVDAARVLRATFRDGDVVARLGGDEFGVLATKATMENAPAILCRLESHLARFNAEAGRDFGLSLSAGVTPYVASDGGLIGDLLKRADARMYERKRAKKQHARGPRLAIGDVARR
jgi:diguanylate cyclase (GGDEF)-like protein